MPKTIFVLFFTSLLIGCTTPNDSTDVCELVPEDYGAAGSVPIEVDVIASGLEIPWAIDWLPNGDMLVTERTGDLLLVQQDGTVITPAVAQIPITLSGEGGLLGLAIHPNFSSNRWFYLYFTADAPAGGFQNKVERWILSPDGLSATFDAEIISDIPALTYHNGGRIKFGPDGYLYVGTGDAGEPALSQDINSLAGKILRVSDDGSVPSDNPYDGSLTWIYGVRNNQGFDWFDDGQIAMADHGPSGMVQESFRRDHDEFNIASSGDNLGWPNIYACETENDMVSPTMVWAEAMPPGGLAVYTGTEIPEWNGDVLIGVLGFSDNVPHLHRLQLDNDDKVSTSETYLRNLSGYGRLREVIMGPDGGLYVTTSNCDGRGDCGDGDRILRIGRN